MLLTSPSSEEKSYKLTDYHQREEYKSLCWNKFREGNEIYQKAFAIIGVCDCHYFRAIESIQERRDYRKLLMAIRGKKYYKEYELDIDHYTPHWLYAQSELFPAEVMDYITKWWGYKPEMSKYLPKGYTEYNWPEIFRRNECH